MDFAMRTESNHGIGDDLSRILKEARDGNQAAWKALFDECYPKIQRVVRRKLTRSMRTLYDSTDFANDVMEDLVANLDRLEFPSVDSLLGFLAHVAEQKVIDEHRRQHTLKRDVRRDRSSSANEADEGLQLPSNGPTASQVAQAHEVRQRLLARPDQTERTIIELRQLGYSTSDIAAQTGWDARKVQRFLRKLLDSLGEPGG
jgi:RNA polymerase sigma factor (sigma-70 family)